MDYKEKYEEALERAKKIYDETEFDYVKGITEEIFPEVKESENKHFIMEYLYDGLRKSDEQFKPQFEAAIAWLEKQGKPQDKSALEAWKNMRLEVYQQASGNRHEPNYSDDSTKMFSLTDIDEIFEKIAEKQDKKPTGEEMKTILQTEYEKGRVDAIAEFEQGEPQDKGEISDGYHTFNELYYYRMLYNAAVFNMLPKEWVHKSKKHNDGEECFGGGWFIVMANLPTGQISNHYELKYWDLFQITEKEVADKWDGHTPKEAADRLYKYLLGKQGEKEQLYIRFGEIPTDEKSKIYQGEIEVGIENGVSVYPTFKTNEGVIVLGLNLPVTKTTLYTLQHLIEYDNRPCYLVNGNYVGKDTDGQPLINNVRIIEKIDNYKVKEKKQGE